MSPPRLFTRPTPIAAMALLVINDHLLKTSGVFPGWLTGKLSDFAGLYFAPLLLAELTLIFFPAQDSRGVVKRLVGSAAVVCLLFAAVKLSVEASALWVSALRALSGVGAANVVDPTDLWALVMVPIAILGARGAHRGAAVPMHAQG